MLTIDGLRNFATTHKAQAVAIGSSVAVGGGLAIAGLKAVSTRRKKTTKKKTTKKKTAKKKTTKRKTKKVKPKYARTAGKRKDTSTKRIRMTKNGQPYIILKSGKARFISKRSARLSRKRKGGRY